MKLANVLGELAALLEARAMPYAVVGGLAASARGEARFTRDIDVALMVATDEEAEQCIHGFLQKGYALVATVEQDATHRLATARLRHPDGVVCDLIFATSGIEHEIIASAQRIELLAGAWVTTATAESMIAMKVLSATPKRPRDLGDLQAMLRANPMLDEGLVTSLLEAITIRGYSRGQDLIEKWRRLRTELSE
ncbi:MAG: nucleotidyl transferase AbiEii/AbiGii toxin family protein [Polyangiaceae bacterium]